MDSRQIQYTPLPEQGGGVDQLAQRASEEANTAQAWAENILKTIKEAEKLEPKNELLKLYLDQAQMSLQLAHFYNGYHSAFIYYRLAGKADADSKLYLKEAVEYINYAEKTMYEYDSNLSLCWESMTRRRYLAFNSLYCCKIIRNFLKLQVKNV
jgi:hypothetical protein